MKSYERFALIVMLISVFLGSSAADAQARRRHEATQDREGKFDTGIGAGIMFSPLRFDGQVAGEYFVRNNIGLGIALDLFLRKGTFFSAVPFARYHFHIADWPNLSPYVGVGVGGGGGVRNGHFMDGGFMDIMAGDVGFKYAIRPNILLGPDVSAHIFTDFDASDVDLRILFVTLNWRFGAGR